MKHHQYGHRSMNKLATCHPMLEKIALHALELCPYDITIVHGWRGEDVQNALLASNASTKGWPDSKHNAIGGDGSGQSEAIDFAPWVDGGIPWNDTHIFAVVAGSFFAAGYDLDIRVQGRALRWGGDWDSDGSTKDQKLMDWGHIEIIL
jgi:peptidoglycan L-alanyl-D-glutamate endopeptidase CwlK